MAVRYLDDGNDAGTGLGQSASAKVGFWGATPVAQQSHVANATNSATAAATAVNAVILALETVGILAAS